MSRSAKSSRLQQRFRKHRSSLNLGKRNLHLESLERRQLLAELAQVTMEVTTLSGDSTSTLVAGQEYYLKAYVQDLRGAEAQGVTGAFLDVAVSDNSLITVEDQVGATSGILFSAEYPNDQAADNLVETLSSEFDEVGATTLTHYAGANTPFFQMKFTADAEGELTFSANPAELMGNVFTLEGVGEIDSSEVVYGDVTVQIVSAAELTDDEITLAEDAAPTTIDVLANDTGGAATWTIDSVSGVSNGGTVEIAADGKTVIYTPANNYAGVETFNYTTVDENGALGQATVTVTLNSLNDAPVNVVPAAQTFDSTTRTVVFDGQNALSTSDADVGSGNLRVTLFVNHGKIALASTTGLNFLNGSANDSRYLLFDGSSTDVNAALDGMTYTANANATSDVLTFDTHDLGNSGAGGAQVDRRTVDLTLEGSPAVNQAPVNIAPGAQFYTVQNPTVTFGALNRVSTTDLDVGNGKLRVTLFVNNGTIKLSQTTGLTFLNGSADNTKYLLFDGTQEDINDALFNMTYTANANVASDILTIDTHDLGNTGTGGAKIDRDTISLTRINSPVNQAPVNTAPVAATYPQDTRTVVFDGARQISVNDEDVGDGMLRVTLFVNQGVISLQQTDGLTFLNDTENDTRYLLFDGTQEDINNALVNMTYTANVDAAADVLTIDTHDLGNTGSGGAKTDRDLVALALAGTTANEAPINTVPLARFFTAQDRTITFGSLSRVSTFDPDAGDRPVRVTLFVGQNLGKISLSTTQGLTFRDGANNSDYLLFDGSQDDVNAALRDMTYTAAPGVISDRLTIDVHDLGNSGTGGYKTDRDSVPLALVGTLPNVAPVNITPGNQTFSDSNRTVTFGLLNPIATFDADAGNEDLRVTLFVNNGKIALSSTEGLTFRNGSANNTRYLLFDGSQSDINNALFGMTYTADEGASGDFLTIDTHDLGHSGFGGARTDRDTITLTNSSAAGRSGGNGSGEAGSANRFSVASNTSAAASADALFAEPTTTAQVASPITARDSVARLAELLASSSRGGVKSANSADALFAEVA